MLRLLRIVFILGTPVALVAAYQFYDAGKNLVGQRDRSKMQLTAYLAETATLSGAREKPLRPPEEALEELLAKLIDDTELLGTSVRMDVGQGVQWQPLRFGVQKTKLSLSSASPAESAMAYFSILWQLIEAGPTSIMNAEISAQGDVVSFQVDLELLALQGDGL